MSAERFSPGYNRSPNASVGLDAVTRGAELLDVPNKGRFRRRIRTAREFPTEIDKVFFNDGGQSQRPPHSRAVTRRWIEARDTDAAARRETNLRRIVKGKDPYPDIPSTAELIASDPHIDPDITAEYLQMREEGEVDNDNS